MTSAFALWGAKTLDALGGDVATWTYWSKQASLAAPLRQDVTTVMDLGLMLGALAAASAAGKFAPVWKVPARSLAGAVIGGLLLGYGSRLAFGCNIGAYFSGILSGSLHAWLWLPAAFLGSALGVRVRCSAWPWKRRRLRRAADAPSPQAPVTGGLCHTTPIQERLPGGLRDARPPRANPNRGILFPRGGTTSPPRWCMVSSTPNPEMDMRWIAGRYTAFC